MDDTITRLLEGDQRALSRLITLVERGDPRAPEVLIRIYPHTGRAYCIGVTGPPGVGKSTLVDRLTALIRDEGLSVGIIGVDPTSPYSGGAFLGDRIRMQKHYLDSGVFIRSMASRDGSGGLSRMVGGAVRLLDASGRDIIVVETVGVGQTELGIMSVADTVVVVLVPEAGDIIQTLKAGIMEIADIYVVNKADRQGADKMVAAVTSVLKMSQKTPAWRPPVLAIQAVKDEGVGKLYESIQRHRRSLERDSTLERRREHKREQEFLDTVGKGLQRRLEHLMANDTALLQVLEQVKKGTVDPYAAATKVLEEDIDVLKGPGASSS